MLIRLGNLLLLLVVSLSLSAQVEVIVEFASAKTLRAAKDGLTSSSSRDGNAVASSLNWYTLQSAGERNIAVVKSSKTLEEWEAIPGIMSVKISKPITARSRIPNDPSFPEQWDMEKIEAPAAWEYTTGGTSFNGREIVIGVIEFGGFQLDHPDLIDNIYVNEAEILNDGIDNDNNGFVDDFTGWDFQLDTNIFTRDSHGTKVLGTLGAKGDNSTQAVGVNWDTRMIPLRVTRIGQWITALDYLTDLRRRYNLSNGTEGAYIVVANMSIGAIDSGTCDEGLNDAFDRAGEQGILSIGATSNSLGDLDQTPDLSSDCKSDYLVIVTASTQEDDIFLASGYSTTDVDICAPGSPYTTLAYVNSGNPSTLFQGTSGATPHVAGAVALAYAIDCSTLDEISLVDPAGAALIVRDAILSSGDDAVGNAALSTSGKRLNIRRAIELLLEEDCLLGDMIVQLDEGQAAPATLTVAAGELNLVRTLSQDWNMHLYNTAGGAILDHVAQLEEMTSVVAAEPNVRLILRGRQPNDPGYPIQDNLDDMGVDDAWETIYGPSAAPPPSKVVTAVFDQNFNLTSEDLDGRVFSNDAELASNGIDDDGNGYVDDNNGFNLTARSTAFSAGNHGFAVSALIAANANDGFGIAGVDWSGKVLPLQGNSLDQWIEGASYVAALRTAYNESNGADGALVISYVSPQGGTLVRQGGMLISNVLDRMDNVGVLAIGATVNDGAVVESDFPSSINHVGLLNTAYGFKGNAEEDVRGFSASNTPLYLAADNSPYGLTRFDTLRLSGSSAAAALAAGSYALLYQLPCSDFETQAYLNPSSTAIRLKRALYRSVGSSVDYRTDILQLGEAARQGKETCAKEEGSDCTVISLFPNPITTEGTLTFEIVSGKDNSTCPLSIYDVLGRVIFQENTSVENGYLELNVDFSEGLANGLYYLKAGVGKDSETFPFVSLK
ncbi:MAG: S8 family serine peptidase [Saprospiraceae bacterium]